LVIRFGALGDLCLLAWSLTQHAAGSLGERPRLTVVTKTVYADLLRRVEGVDEVVVLPGSRFRDLSRLARRLRSCPFDAVIDAHNTLRSRLLLTMMGRRPEVRLAKDTLARLGLLLFRRRTGTLNRSMHDRFHSLFVGIGSTASRTDGAEVDLPPAAVPPLQSLAPLRPETRPILGIAPGARWDTKRWPDEHFAHFLRSWRASSSAPVHIFLGPQERAWFDTSALAAEAARLADVIIHAPADLPLVASRLAACTTVLTNDSGLLHLAEAVGTPVLAIFGPTVREFGYFPTLADSVVLERSLACRPCSRNGKRPCWRRDLACLKEISPEQVVNRILALPAWGGAMPREDFVE
jgi:heptosyltransferase-2